MPITAKLSRKFYEKFGDELTNELVEWLNSVDAGYRSELRQLMEANLAHIDARFDAFEARFDAKLDAKLGARLETFEAKLDAKLEAKLGRLEGGLIARIGLVEARRARQTMLYWIATMGTIVALLKL